MKGGKQPGKTTGQRQQALKERRKAAGLVRLEVWVKVDHVPAVKEFARILDKGNFSVIVAN